MFHYIDGGADDEWTMRRNISAFDDYELLPSCLVDVDRIDLSTHVLGCELKLPFFLAPTGMSRLFHQDRELGVARAADRFGTMYSLSTVGTTSLEDIADAAPGPRMFQLYILKDRGLTTEFIERCKAAKYQALCLTVDLAVAGNRERDKVHGMTMPPRFGLKSLWSFATHPAWTLNVLRHRTFELANVAHRMGELEDGTSLMQYVNQQFDRSVTWDDAAAMIEQWGGPFVIKGIVTAEDAIRARAIGATAVMVSNHGGRQLDGAPAAIDCIAPIRDAVGNDLEIIVDSGIRRGTHMLKALALGADCCAVGRPYLYGLGAAGEEGVDLALGLLKDELERDMRLMGLTSMDQLQPGHVRKVGARPTV